ncbi:862_t:CDS:2, partial [Gigaspora margarita]
MLRQNFVETFRFLNSDTQAYTWLNGSTATRINQIWISEGLIKNLYKAKILDMDLIIESDHSTVLVNLKSEYNMHDYTQRANWAEGSHLKFLYNKATTENWKEYKLSLQYFLRKCTSSLDTLNKNMNKILQKNIDNIWVSIETEIFISKICQELKKLARENKNQKAILALSSKRALEIRLLLYIINTRHKTNIDLDETASIEKWAQDIK